ncbi:MAG: hypothetical protein GX030_08555 [Firmicutes bacterium]|nr:hypothetical protein [Bacillota bacterium]
MLKIGTTYWKYWKAEGRSTPLRPIAGPAQASQSSSEKYRWNRLLPFGNEFRYYKIQER